MMGALGATAVVLPELEALRGCEQSRFHHLDVYGHTLEVLERTVELTSAAGPEPASSTPASARNAPRWTRCSPSRWPTS